MPGKVVRPVYLYALAGVVAALVLASGALQITRTKRELVSIYEGSARSLADGVEQLVGQALSMVDVSGHGPADAAKAFALDDVLLDYLFGLAADLDRTLPSHASGDVRMVQPSARSTGVRSHTTARSTAVRSGGLFACAKNTPRGTRSRAATRSSSRYRFSNASTGEASPGPNSLAF